MVETTKQSITALTQFVVGFSLASVECDVFFMAEWDLAVLADLCVFSGGVC